jgi:hypothetical protein
MRAYRMDGMYVDPKITIEDKGYTWEFEVPGRAFRYTMKLNDKGQWHEVGEVSMDGGKTWRKLLRDDARPQGIAQRTVSLCAHARSRPSPGTPRYYGRGQGEGTRSVDPVR